jgi:hypothetical protein
MGVPISTGASSKLNQYLRTAYSGFIVPSLLGQMSIPSLRVACLVFYNLLQPRTL